jgi:restriction system protein
MQRKSHFNFARPEPKFRVCKGKNGMKSYYRVMLGRKSIHAEECFVGNFIGAGFGIDQDLTHKLPDEWRDFNKEFIPVFLAKYPEKSKIAAGLACGFLWTVSKGIKNGDIVLCPDGTGRYQLGEVTGDYFYVPDTPLPHRRPVHWSETTINRASMSQPLQNSTGAIGTISNVTSYADEIEMLIGGVAAPKIVATDLTIENAASFAMEKHLEDFLVQNWAGTELGREIQSLHRRRRTGRAAVPH